MKKIAYILATGFGSGYSPIAPGTAGALFFMIVCGWMMPGFPLTVQMILTVMLFVIGVYSSNIVEADLIAKIGEEKGHDAGCIVIDEVVGMAISLIAVPNTWWAIITAIVLFRLFDIVKPFPVNKSQNLPRGWGIMMDDVIAGLYTNIIIQIVERVW